MQTHQMRIVSVAWKLVQANRDSRHWIKSNNGDKSISQVYFQFIVLILSSDNEHEPINRLFSSYDLAIHLTPIRWIRFSYYSNAKFPIEIDKSISSIFQADSVFSFHRKSLFWLTVRGKWKSLPNKSIHSTATIITVFSKSGLSKREHRITAKIAISIDKPCISMEM